LVTAVAVGGTTAVGCVVGTSVGPEDSTSLTPGVVSVLPVLFSASAPKQAVAVSRRTAKPKKILLISLPFENYLVVVCEFTELVNL